MTRMVRGWRGWTSPVELDGRGHQVLDKDTDAVKQGAWLPLLGAPLRWGRAHAHPTPRLTCDGFVS